MRKSDIIEFYIKIHRDPGILVSTSKFHLKKECGDGNVS
jgi:hypothetical protein